MLIKLNIEIVIKISVTSRATSQTHLEWLRWVSHKDGAPHTSKDQSWLPEQHG